MPKYKYIGQTEVQMPHVGIIKPDEIISSKTKINHPLFEEVKPEAKEDEKAEKKSSKK